MFAALGRQPRQDNVAAIVSEEEIMAGRQV